MGRPAVSYGISILGQSEQFLFTVQKLHDPNYSLQTYRSHTETRISVSLLPCALHLEGVLLQVTLAVGYNTAMHVQYNFERRQLFPSDLIVVFQEKVDSKTVHVD